MNILFICSSNVRRSQMCQAICEIRYPKYNYRSAGFDEGHWDVAGQTVEHMTETLGKEYGDKIRGRYSRQIAPNVIRWADLIFVMEKVQKENIEIFYEDAKNKTFVLGDYAGVKYGIDSGINARNLADICDKAIARVDILQSSDAFNIVEPLFRRDDTGL